MRRAGDARWSVEARGSGPGGAGASPLCPARYATSASGTDAAGTLVEESPRASLAGRTAPGALACPTPAQCLVVQSAGSGFRATALSGPLGPGPTA